MADDRPIRGMGQNQGGGYMNSKYASNQGAYNPSTASGGEGEGGAHNYQQPNSYGFTPSPQLGMPLQGAPSPSPPTPINTSAIYGKRTANSMVIADLALRAAAAVLLLVGLCVVATASYNDNGDTKNFTDRAALGYAFSVSLIGLVYTLYQAGAALFRFLTGKNMIPEAISHYCCFIGDQVLAYLLISAGSAGAALITLYQDACNTAKVNFCAQAAGGISMVFLAFTVVVTSFMLSTYTLFKHLFT